MSLTFCLESQHDAEEDAHDESSTTNVSYRSSRASDGYSSVVHKCVENPKSCFVLYGMSIVNSSPWTFSLI